MTASPRAVEGVDLRLLAVGVAAGVGSGFFGIGGGTIMVPGMVFLAAFSQHRAHATSLGAVIPIAAVAVIPFVLAGEVDAVLALVLAAGSLVGARFGAVVMHRLSERQLRLAFALLLLITVVEMFASPGTSLVRPGGVAWVVLGVLLGLVGGFASALLGVGGGLVLVPGMAVLLGVPQHLAQGTSLLTIIPTAIVGAASHRRSGLLDWRPVALLAAGGIVAGFLASNFALGIDELLLRRAFAVYAFLILVRLLWNDPFVASIRGRLLGRPPERDATPPEPAPAPATPTEPGKE